MAKTIVITGAGVGLGRALARRFTSEGEQVILLGRTLSKIEDAANDIGERASAIQCDVGCPDSVRNAFAAIAKQHATIDVLINNAALFEPFKIAEASDAQILNAVVTNLAGPMLCARSAIPMMQRGSLIINVTSESVDMAFPHLSVYQSTKAGVERFSKSLYQELDPDGIRVTNIRAGQMFEEGKTWDVDPEARKAFGMAAIAAGINLLERPLSQFESVTEVFRAVIDLPADLHVAAMNLHARKSQDEN